MFQIIIQPLQGKRKSKNEKARSRADVLSCKGTENPLAFLDGNGTFCVQCYSDGPKHGAVLLGCTDAFRELALHQPVAIKRAEGSHLLPCGYFLPNLQIDFIACFQDILLAFPQFRACQALRRLAMQNRIRLMGKAHGFSGMAGLPTRLLAGCLSKAPVFPLGFSQPIGG